MLGAIMINDIAKLSNNLKKLGFEREASRIGILISAIAVKNDDSGRLAKQIAYFKSKVYGSPAKEYVDKSGKKRVRKATLPQPLAILAPYYKGWSEDQMMVYPHLKIEAVEVLLSQKIQINWQNPVPEDAQYMYFNLSTPDDVPIYKDKELSEFEPLAAELTAERFPDYFIQSEYLNDSFPELKDVAEQAKTDVVYFEEKAEEYEDSIEYAEDE